MGSNILYVKLNAYEIPEFKENKGKEWISYGADNNFPALLLEMYDNAPKHRAIVDGKADLVAGKGWNVNNKALSVLNAAKLIEFTQSINPSESLYELTKKLSLDLELFGGFYIQAIWNNLRTDFDLYHVDFSKIRTNKTQDKFFFSNDWKAYNQSPEKTGFKEIEKFDPEKKTSGIFYYKAYRPNQGVYPLPGYVAALKYIEIEKEIANFHLNNIKNGFVGGTLISFNNGQPTLEEQKEIEKQIKSKHTGTDNAGGVVLVFSEGKDKEPSVIPLRSNDFDKAFEVLNKTVTQEIFTGHRITSGQLFGIDGESAFARNVIRDASEFFQNTYVTPKQQTLEGVINDFSNLLNIDGKLNIIPLEIIGVDYSEALIQAVIPIELLRKKVAERLGIELNEGQKFSKELTEAEALEVFDKYGESSEGYEVIHAEAIPVNFATITITTLDKSIIDLLSNDNLISNKNLADALKVDVKTIEEEIKKLTDNGLIEIVDNERNLTKKGESIKKLDSPVEEILVRYKYDKKPGIEGKPLLSTSRDFCVKMITDNKQYTRQDIESMTNDLGTNVWLTRGGWYHNPKTGLTSTSCRHIWQQVLLRKKA